MSTTCTRCCLPAETNPCVPCARYSYTAAAKAANAEHQRRFLAAHAAALAAAAAAFTAAADATRP